MKKDSADTGLKRRIATVQVLLVAALFILGAKSVEIQFFKAAELAQKAANDYSKLFQITGERGEILDRHMNKLAASTAAVSVTACPAKIQSPEKTAKTLSAILNIDQRHLKNILSSDRMFAWVARRISPDQADRIRALKLSGIYFEKDYKRVYPNREIAAQVIGFTGSENEGLEGLEFALNSILKGRTEKVVLKRSGNGDIFGIDQTRNASLKGKSIVLTLDKKIQYMSEQAIKRTALKYQAKSGMAMVMRPSTGELLSIAHFPGFNPNHFKEQNKSSFRNRSVTDPFEPGSVIKVFTAAAALERGFSPKSIFFCENGKYNIGRFTIHDTHDHDWLSINQIIKYSSNIGAIKIVETIGDKALYDHLSAFGFGTKTRLGCPGETSGRLLPLDRWSRIDAGAIAFGQGISVSAIQLITAISAIANDGKLMKPMLIKRVLSNSGETLKENRPQMVRQVISRKTADHVKRMMNLVVQEEGTGVKAAIDGYTVCGKTGTAQKALPKSHGYSKSKYISVFAGFAPLDAPELAVLVVVDEPKNKYYGGEVAGPVFKDIMTESFNYLNIPPQKAAQMIAAVSKEGIK
jgi:cell division protein FtsI (penicillin-binding protein 3)